MPNHSPFVSLIDTGILSYKKNTVEKSLTIHHGFFEINNNKLTILVDSAEHKEQLDRKRAEDALKRVSKRLKEEKNINLERAKKTLKRAKTRIKFLNK